jgi:hypothetical protein
MRPTPEQALRILTAVRLALAAGWLAPGLTAKLFGVDADDQPALRYLIRLFAVRDGVLGVLQHELEGEQLDRLLEIGIAMDAADVAAAGLAGVTGQLPKRAVLMAGGTAALAVWLGIEARKAR